ncbi:unnamed protein product, partial [Sphacelaria rigidula]
GGALLIADHNVTVSADTSLFLRNTAGARGGAVALQGGNFTADDCFFRENVVSNSLWGRGGAIAATTSGDDAEHGPSVSLRGGQLRGNSVEAGEGGAVFGEFGA